MTEPSAAVAHDLDTCSVITVEDEAGLTLAADASLADDLAELVLVE